MRSEVTICHTLVQWLLQLHQCFPLPRCCHLSTLMCSGSCSIDTSATRVRQLTGSLLQAPSSTRPQCGQQLGHSAQACWSAGGSMHATPPQILGTWQLPLPSTTALVPPWSPTCFCPWALPAMLSLTAPPSPPAQSSLRAPQASSRQVLSLWATASCCASIGAMS